MASNKFKNAMNFMSSLKNNKVQVPDPVNVVPVQVDNTKELERTYKHYELFLPNSNELKTAFIKAGLNESEYKDYLNYVDNMNKEHVKAALAEFKGDSGFEKSKLDTF